MNDFFISLRCFISSRRIAIEVLGQQEFIDLRLMVFEKVNHVNFRVSNVLLEKKFVLVQLPVADWLAKWLLEQHHTADFPDLKQPGQAIVYFQDLSILDANLNSTEFDPADVNYGVVYFIELFERNAELNQLLICLLAFIAVQVIHNIVFFVGLLDDIDVFFFNVFIFNVLLHCTCGKQLGLGLTPLAQPARVAPFSLTQILVA